MIKIFAFIFGLVLLVSCNSVKCPEPNQKKYLTVEYKILDPSDCGWTGIIKDGEFYLEINGTRHDSLLLFPLNISKANQIIRTSYDFKDGNENLRIRIIDKNMLTSLLDVVKNNLPGYYKVFGEVYSILKETSFLKKFLDNFVECGAENLIVTSSLASDNSSKELTIRDISGKDKVRLKIYYICR